MDEQNPSLGSKVRTRFAPSPTGFGHIGNFRTALFNYLFSHHHGGSFVLRIEDTDRERYVPEALDYILKALNWLGLQSDEGPEEGGPFAPYIQSERLDLYGKHADELLSQGLAYKDEGAIRFKTIKEGVTVWTDLIGSKNISFENKTQEDFIILKSDGYPTYNFANIIDDHYMEISHVIRGAEFISSTPKHIMLYQSFKWQQPQFGHVPLILGTDRSKLSKRHGANPVFDYQKDGFLSEALVNYLALLGWTPPSGKEILSLEEMITEFKIEDVHVAPAVFDIRKLEWMNGEYIRKSQNSNLKTQIYQYTRELSGGALTPQDHPTEEEIEKLVPLIKDRIKKLSDFIPLTDFIFEKPEYDMAIFAKFKIQKSKVKTILEKVSGRLEEMERPWEAEEFEKTFRELADEMEIKAGDVFQLIRVAVSGQLVTPPLFESIKIIGEEEVLSRVKEVNDKVFN